MRTYFVRSCDYNDLNRLKKSAKFFERYKHRAIVVTNAEVETRMIVKSFDGDISEDHRQWYPWVRSSIIEDLNHEFVAQAPVSQASWTKAVRKWEGSQKKVQEAETALQAAIDAQREAAAGIIRVNGMAPLVLNGKTYDPFSYVTKEGREVVSFRERTRKNKFDTL